MKKISSRALLFTSASILLSIAWTSKKTGNSSRTYSAIAEYTKVVVSENLTVVFRHMPGNDVFVQGQEGLVNAVNFNVAHGTLFITAKRNAAFYEGAIYLPVKNLAEINVKANSSIYNEGVMKCDNLTVYIAEGSHA
jgi:hypothetical protein